MSQYGPENGELTTYPGTHDAAHRFLPIELLACIRQGALCGGEIPFSTADVGLKGADASLRALDMGLGRSLGGTVLPYRILNSPCLADVRRQTVTRLL